MSQTLPAIKVLCELVKTQRHLIVENQFYDLHYAEAMGLLVIIHPRVYQRDSCTFILAALFFERIVLMFVPC